MGFVCIIVVLAILSPIFADKINNKKFPEGFMFGTATASYQVEGGWNADGKGPNIWDTIVHERPDYILNKENGDIACDSYHKYKEDVKMMKYLGVNHYRFSLSWARILPKGFSNQINQLGVQYYKNLISELKANNIEPLVTLYHWDLPQTLQNAGGWTNPNIIKWFSDYAKICFELFGDSVKYWLTFNEPKQVCHMGYGTGDMAPAITTEGLEYLCAHNLLLAHAKAYHDYDELFRKSQKGKVGFVIDSLYYQPESNSTEDIAAAETGLQFTFGWYANPLVYGDYPAVMKEHLSRRSKNAGYKNSVLPEFTKEQSSYVKGSQDYLGVNMYSSFLTRPGSFLQDNVGFDLAMEILPHQPSTWNTSATSWLKVTPWGMRGLVSWISKTYNNISMIITENGISDNGYSLNDDDRIDYIRTYLSSLRDAMEFDNVNVFGYTYWSLMDNFEWTRGYSEKYGLFHVDFSLGNRTRTPKKSVEYYKKVISTKCLVDKCV